MFVMFVLTFLLETLANASSFIISEIYANGPGLGADRRKEWLEITNISRHFAIKQLQLLVYEEGQTAPLYDQKRQFNPSLPFDRPVLIAQDLKLGLKKICIGDDIPRVIIPAFSLKNNGPLKICVVLNEEHQHCATVHKNTKRRDGISLYRDTKGQIELTIYRAEPCHLIDDVFATPGLVERACINDPNWRDAIFDDCSDDIVIGPDKATVLSPLSLDLKLQKQAEQNYLLHYKLEPKEMPMNFTIKNKEGHTLSQFSIIEKPNNQRKLSLKETDLPLMLHYNNQHQTGYVSLSAFR